MRRTGLPNVSTHGGEAPLRRRTDTLAAVLPIQENTNKRRPCLTAIRGQLPGRLYVLRRGSTTLGRAVSNNITLTDRGVSRHHARIDVDEDTVVITDVGSSNGTFIGGERVQHAVLSDRAKISVGGHVTLRLDWLDATDRAFQIQQFEGLTRDPLTQCHNRTYLSEEFLRAASIAHRTGEPLCAMMLDLDHFKRVNDRWGHAMGDAALRTVTHKLQRVVRDGDVLARVGGEEFVLLMPHTDLKTATTVAERVRFAVSQAQQRVRGDELIEMTVSIGVASLDEVNRHSPETLLTLADARVYRAKDQGRNCVVAEGGEPREKSVWHMSTDQRTRSVARIEMPSVRESSKER